MLSNAYVSPGFFRTLGIDLLTGRDFGTADDVGAPAVAIVNERYAERLESDRDVLGRRVPFFEGELEIIGLVADAKYADVTSEIGPQLFQPLRQQTTLGDATFYVRGERPPEELMNASRETAARVDPIVPIANLRTMEQQVRENLAVERFLAGTSTAFSSP